MRRWILAEEMQGLCNGVSRVLLCNRVSFVAFAEFFTIR